MESTARRHAGRQAGRQAGTHTYIHSVSHIYTLIHTNTLEHTHTHLSHKYTHAYLCAHNAPIPVVHGQHHIRSKRVRKEGVVVDWVRALDDGKAQLHTF